MISLLKVKSIVSIFLLIFFIAVTHTVRAEKIKPGTTYGPLSKTDTLWSIAQSVEKEKNININQVIFAISENNPKAFMKKGNIHVLRKDVYLNIPSSQEIAAISKQQAYEFMVAQNKPAQVVQKKTSIEKKVILNIKAIEDELNKSEHLLSTLKIKDPSLYDELLALQQETAKLLKKYQQQL